MHPKVFVIILNWNGWRDTLECLKSLKQNNYWNYKIVVVDNGSTDNSLDRLQDIDSDKRISLLPIGTNLGFSGGNNIGIKYALKNGADYILLLNNDTKVDKYFLSELIKQAEGDRNGGLFGPKIYYHDNPEVIWFAGGKININPFEVNGTHIGLNKPDSEKYNQIKKVDYITGCCFLIKKEVIDKIGFLDEDYFLYYEDADYCLRARKAGYKCTFVPSAKIWHKCSVGTHEGSSSYVYYHTRNALIMARKNGSFFEKIFIFKLTGWIFIKQIFKIIFIPKKREWAKSVLQGLEDFYLRKTGKYENWH
ncbi:glycosyltransferase family 2 protein [Patescibacteria group bacterium]